jgi:hypothetical protein
VLGERIERKIDRLLEALPMKMAARWLVARQHVASARGGPADDVVIL